ncbi:G-protein_alpha subunit [Hexamita inflata]|uniref:G-protein alpha subunit n=1 Tax=Hexamita inflata TaxID=28002 RepID=A0AA86RLP5_9EUKA|nr:G-protein alpha subunit [Hexamita inflata]
MSCCTKRKYEEINTSDDQPASSGANTMKILLLGAGEGGKSTWVKQMRLLYQNGFTSVERNYYKTIIFQNVIKSTVAISQNTAIPELQNLLKCPLTPASLSDSVISTLNNLLQNTEFQNALLNTPIVDNYTYFISRLPFLANNLPTNQDILLARVKTHIETPFTCTLNKLKYIFYDVAGQRPARSTWNHRLSEANAFIFFCSLSDFDQTLIEDATTNRLRESLQLWTELVNSPLLEKVPVILCLNKMDLLVEKLKTRRFSDYISEYKGENEAKSVADYVQGLFVAANKVNAKIRPYKVFQTSISDQGLIQNVCKSVFEFMLQAVLKQVGFF